MGSRVPAYCRHPDGRAYVRFANRFVYDDPESAILREKRLKRWKRDWKIELIESVNPKWEDLYDTLLI